MITKEQLAVASIAQVFGSELLKVQESAMTDSGYRPQIVSMDPKQILLRNNGQASPQSKISEMNALQNIQALAEATHPLPPPQDSPQPKAANSVPTNIAAPVSAAVSENALNGLIKVLESISSNTKVIADSIQKIANITS